MTAALEGGEESAARPGRILPTEKDVVPIVQEAGWATGPDWAGGKSRPTRIRSPDRQAVARRYTDCPSRTRVHKVVINFQVVWNGQVWRHCRTNFMRLSQFAVPLQAKYPELNFQQSLSGSFGKILNCWQCSCERHEHKFGNFIFVKSHSTYPFVEVEVVDDEAALNDDYWLWSVLEEIDATSLLLTWRSRHSSFT